MGKNTMEKKNGKSEVTEPALQAKLAETSEEESNKKLDQLAEETLAGLEEFLPPDFLAAAKQMVRASIYGDPGVKQGAKELIAQRELDPGLDKCFEHLKPKADAKKSEAPKAQAPSSAQSSSKTKKPPAN